MSMRTITTFILGTLVLGAFLAIDHWAADAASRRKSERGYPLPIYVYFPDDVSEEELFLLARYQARQVETNWGQLGVIEPGKKGLITYRAGMDDRPQDLRVLEACKKAVEERGADVDYIQTADLLQMYGYPREWADFRETAAIDGEFKPLIYEISSRFVNQSGHGALGILSPAYVRKISELAGGNASKLIETSQTIMEAKVAALKKYVDSHPEYQYLFLDWAGGGPTLNRLLQVFGNKYQSAWRITNADKLARGAMMPDEIWDAAQEKQLEVIPWIEHVKVDDPEGTHLEFSVTPEEAELWRKGAYVPGTTLMYPLQATRWLYRQTGIKKLVVPDANGVIAGTMGHNYYYPRVQLKVEHGVVTDIKGTGLMADLMRDVQTKYKDVQLPLFPRPGWFYVFQLSLGLSSMRGGVYVDFGFGPEVRIPEIENFAEEHGIAITHEMHINQAFITYDATVTGGKTIRLAEKGDLLVNDDPEIRAIASKYGDPDDLLRAENKRPIPGINYPGSYEEYARNPYPFSVKAFKMVRDRTWPYMERGKPLQLRELGREY